jgi:hypothetical protein
VTELQTVADTPPTKVCPKCSIQEATGGAFCPHCGAPYEGRRRKRPSRRVLAAGLVLVVVAGGAGAAVAKHSHDQKVHRQEVAAERARQVAAAKRREAAAEAARVEGAAKSAAAAKKAENAIARSVRASIVTSIRKSITKDARKDVAEGLLDGPITGTTCQLLSSSSLSSHTGRYQCIAVNKTSADGTQEGYRFAATANYDTGSYTWHLGS